MKSPLRYYRPVVSIESILKRRSIRRYTKEKVSDDEVEAVLRAGMCAPSAGNERPWHFVVIKERRSLEEISVFQPHANMVKEAQLAILVCADEQLEKYRGFWPQDCAAAMENMLLACTSLGLGSVWLGIYPIEDRVATMRNFLGMPSHMVPFALMPIGRPAENRPTNDRYEPDRVHQERW
jgi:nitroreductase